MKNTPDLPQTHVIPSPDGSRKKSAAAARRLVWEDAKRNLGFVVAFVTLIGCVLAMVSVINTTRATKYVFLPTSPGTVVYGGLVDMQDTNVVYEIAAQNATFCVMNRGPGGLDNPLLVEKLFTRAAQEKLRKLTDSEMPDLLAKDIREKAEVYERTKYSEGDGGVITMVVTGYLIRSGVAGDFAIRDTPKYRLSVALVPNSDLGTNGMWPYLVADFKRTISPKD